MITDEQIWQIAKKYLCSVGSHYINEMAMPGDGRIEEFARELIALAQQIKPLEWVEVSDALKVVKTICGEYAVFNSITVVSAKFADDEYYSRLFQTEAEAIEAAQQDYQRRVLGCLKFGEVGV
jgi:hypothetical protein